MFAVRNLVSSCLALMLCAPAGAVAANDDGQAKIIQRLNAIAERQQLIFFVAKGAPNACGPGCHEWIAAEGRIDQHAAQRFKDFLASLPRRDVPIFFNSLGGDSSQAMSLGLILRENRMTAGVARTVAEGCRPVIPIEEACRRIMLSKREHKSRLFTDGARCASGCVYAFVGASVRHVASGATLLIHSVWGSSEAVQVTHNRLRRYVVELGIDPGLVDAAAKVSSHHIRAMNRDEIVRFGVEFGGLYETPWLVFRGSPERILLLKSATYPVEHVVKKFQTRTIRLGCTPFWPGERPGISAFLSPRVKRARKRIATENSGRNWKRRN